MEYEIDADAICANCGKKTKEHFFLGGAFRCKTDSWRSFAPSIINTTQLGAAAKDAELTEMKAVVIARVERIRVLEKSVTLLTKALVCDTIPNKCLYCTYSAAMQCDRPESVTCADGVIEWALAEARKEQEEANESRNASEDGARYGDDCSG